MGMHVQGTNIAAATNAVPVNAATVGQRSGPIVNRVVEAAAGQQSDVRKIEAEVEKGKVQSAANRFGIKIDVRKHLPALSAMVTPLMMGGLSISHAIRQVTGVTHPYAIYWIARAMNATMTSAETSTYEVWLDQEKLAPVPVPSVISQDFPNATMASASFAFSNSATSSAPSMLLGTCALFLSTMFLM